MSTSKTPPPPAPKRKDSLGESERGKTVFIETAKRAVKEHEELKRKYSEREEQTKLLAEELEQTKEILQMLESVSGKVIDEYTEVQTKLDVETQCRKEAEKYATETVREIKELKRKSQMVFQQNGIDFSKIVDISLDDDEPTDMPLHGLEEAPLAKELEAQIEMLKGQVVNAKKDLGFAIKERDICREDLNGAYCQIAQLKEDLRNETLAHELTKKALQERDNVINQLKRVSTMVYDGYNDFQRLYHQETAMRVQAEKLASEYYAKNKEAEAFKRRSAMLLSDTLGADVKLHESLTEVEKLSQQIEEEREAHKMELKRVKDELELSEDRERMEILENKLSIAKEENESLEMRIRDMEMKNKELAYELKEAKSQPSLPNIPPPPPPPPMPVLPKNPLEMLQKMLGKKHHKVQSQQTRQLDGFQKQYETAMQDMVNRIKKGQVRLRKTRVSNDKSPDDLSPTKPGTAQAIKELDSILMNLKNRRHHQFKSSPKDKAGPEPELMAIMEQRRLRSQKPPPAPPTSSRPSPRPRANLPSPSHKLSQSTSLDTGTTNKTNVPPPPVSAKRGVVSTASDPLPAQSISPDSLYSTVHHEPPLSPPSTPSSTFSSIISTSSQEIEIQNNPAFIHDSGDERAYASVDPPSPLRRHQIPPPCRLDDMSLEDKFEMGNDCGQYSVVDEMQLRPTPSPRRKPSEPKTEPEPYYSEVNI